jgi:penicillin-binding protein 1A
VPPGLVNVSGEWFYEEYARSGGVASVGVEGGAPGSQAPGTPPPTEERNRILDLFRN